MRKGISLLVFLALIAGGVSAQISMSSGGGALFDYSLNNGVEASFGGETLYMGIRTLSIGGFAFYDATYAEADFHFSYGLTDMVSEGGGESDSQKFGNALQLGFSLFGKYPIQMGSITVFPLLGVNYNWVFSFTDDNGNSYSDAGNLSQLSLLFGGGLDYNINDTFFVRGELLFGLRFASKFQDDLKSLLTYTITGGTPVAGLSVDTTLGMGPCIKIGIGKRL